MGYEIFILCLRQLRNHIRVAFQLSWFWISVYLGVLGLLMWFEAQSPQDPLNPSPPSIQIVIAGIIFIIVMFIGFSVIAIGWHRFVLREEMPDSVYVLRPKWPIGRYFWNSIKVTFAVLIFMIPLFVILFSMLGVSALTNVTAITPGFSKIFLVTVAIQFTLGVFGTWLFLRMGTVLPALAVGERMTLRASFQLTKPISGPLITTAFCVVLLQFIPILIQLLMVLITGPETMLFTGMVLVASVVFSFISFFVGFGILTVIYGHLAEGKPI